MRRNSALLGGIKLLAIVLLPQIITTVVEALHFSDGSETFAKFPKWDACTNSSFSFEFKTFTSKALLMYTDDRGKFDYAEVALIDGKVRLRMNIVDGQDGTIEITLGERLNDGNWHRVEIQRKRMETTLNVDDKRESMVAFGSDFQFGNIFENNFVYFGGIPIKERKRLNKWSLPSALYLDRFVGDIRNVIYGNCTCAAVRGVMIEGTSVSRDPPEACEVKNDCGECLCISSEGGTGCQCEGRRCASDTDTYYSLPMDSLIGDKLGNPSGLDARVIGDPTLVPGIVGKALQIDGRTQEVRVSGPGHRHECFGDLELCPAGYTLAMWVRFDRSGKANNIYLSDGGQSDHSHGVTMYYMSGQIQWLFRTKSGKEWRVTANDILPRGWYHVLITWLNDEGLRLYINGEKVAHAGTSAFRQMRTGTSLNDDFVIGQSNDGSGSRDMGIITIDEFQFWSSSMTDAMLRENGPVYKYHISMDRIRSGQLIVRQLETTTNGVLRQVPGKFGNAVLIRGNGEYIDLGPFSGSCLGNTTVCKYGIYMSFWVKFHALLDNTYYMASGETGFSIFSNKNRLIASVQNGNMQWRTSTSGIQTETWYFIEVSWSLESGLRLFINLKKVASSRTTRHNPITQSRFNNFYIGRANGMMYRENYANATFDDIELFNADRKTLLKLDFIQRDKPTHKHYGFDDMTESRIEHGSSVIQTVGRPKLVPGKIGQGLHLTGEAQTADFRNGDDCLANLDYCRHGVLMSLWFRPDKFSSTSTMHYLSSGINGISLVSHDGRFSVNAQTSANRWMVMTSDLVKATWYFLEVAWSRKGGLLLYVNKRLVADNLFPTGSTGQASESTQENGKFVLGTANAIATESMYGAATFDELEYWFASRDYLLAFGYIQRDTPTQFLFTMDEQTVDGQSLAHAPFPVILHGEPELVPGKINKALQLNGSEQYIDFGDQTDKCLGNLDKCSFGISIFFWVKIDDFDSNMYILSTGSLGIRIYYNDGYVYITINNKNKSWRTSFPKFQKDEWHYLELSWHPQHGLNLYVDYTLLEHVEFREYTLPFSGTGSRNLLIGGPNSGDVSGQRFSFAFMTVDEFEIWYARRETLLAFDYIVRDNVGYESFSMETASNDVIDHPRYNITLERGARLLPGKVGNAVSLEGRGQYVNLGEHMGTCLGNLDLCNHGITMSLWLKPRNLRNNTYYLSGPTYDLLYKDSKLRARVISHGKVWNVQTRQFKNKEWNNVMLSWDKKDGLELYIDNDVMSIDRAPVDAAQRDEAGAGNLYVGKSSDDSATGRTANIMADEVQYWFANIERLRAQGIFDGPIHEVIPISQMSSSGVLKLPTRTITMYGGATIVRGQHMGAVKLNGKGQYIDLGENLTCGGNLDKCRQGFTMRFSVKPEKLVRNMYLLDSYPVSIFYRDGKLYATVRTPTKTWTVAAPGFKIGEWQVVDVSWHPEIGLTMYINDEEVGAHKTHATEIDPQYDWDTGTYFGRSLTDMADKRYADAVIENFEIWNVRRDALLSNGRISGDVDVKPEILTTTKAPPPPNDAGTTVRQIFVTSIPTADSQGFNTRVLNSTYAGTSKIIRFFGDSYVRYDFNVLPAEMLAPATKESLSFTFITQDTEGLMWMFKTAGYKMHISMKEGSLLFVIDDGLLPQQVVITSPNSRPLNDFRWHSLKIDKEGKVLKFYMDEKYVTQLTARTNVQFVARGEVDLGGTPLTKTNTGGLVETNFDGALTDVECRKFTGPSRELIISFLQFVESASQTGDIEIFDRDRWNSGNWTWNRFTTTRAPPTPPPKRPTPVTFTSATSAFYLRDPLDMRTSGSVGFRFRTLEPRGLLTIARGSAQGNNFVAIEIFDGILYFVYNFGSYSNRKQFATRRVDDGEWHEVRFESDGRRIYMTLDGLKYPINLKSDEMMKMYFYRLFIGGYDINRMPWPIYSRMGYRGCLASLEINDIGVDLHSRFRDANANGVEVGCRDFARFCQTQPCSSGACKDHMGKYVCNCANTPFSGTTCDTAAVIASWDGTKTTNFEFLNRDVTHTNDMSVRFMTPLADTLLFKTEVSNSDDYIKAELVGGRVKVTIKVGTEMKSFFTGNNLNDYFWHTLYIRRRANDFEVWVDEEPRSVGLIDREDFNLQIDRLIFGSLGEKGSLSSNNYIGYMQNFMYDDVDVFSQLRKLTSNVYWIEGMTPDNLPLLTYKPVTVTTSEAHFKLPYLRLGRTMKLLFKFKTRESNGLILYNSGVGNDVIAIELSNGQLRLAYNLGGRNQFTVVPTQNALNDNQWHMVQVSLSERGQFSLRVDGETMDVTTSDGDNKLTLRNTLYIGGLPEAMYQQPAIRNLIESRKGFRGCLASMDLNGAVPDLLNYATDSQKVLDGCTDIQATCKPGACGSGTCMPGVDDYWCNCNMTGYTGIPCTDEPVGYYFGRNGNSGLVLYEFPYATRTSSNLDQIAFGFMTKQENGVLYRLQGTNAANEYIEIRIENGFIIAESNTGGGKILLQENSRKFNDGNYHVVRYIRTGSNSTLQVDQLATNTATHTGTVSLFDKVHMVMLGGRTGKEGAIIGKFQGILGGAYYNGYRWFDMLLGGKTLHGQLVTIKGDVSLTKPYILIKGGGVKPTPSPPDIYIPPDEDIADDFGGGGALGPGIGGPGSGKPGIIGIAGPGGLTGLPGGVSINVPGEPVALALAGGPALPPMAGGARAGAVVGTVIGTLAFMSSLMWALYKLKPGVPTCLSPGAGSAGAGAGGGGMSISSPARATSNIGAVQAVSAGSGGGGAGAGAGKVTVVNGSASAGGAGAGAGGGGSSTYTSYFQSTSTAVGGGGGAGSAGSAGAGGGSAGVDQFDSATLRATGTFSNKGTAIGTPKAARSNMASSSSYNSNYQTNTMQSYGSGQDANMMGGGGGGGTFDRQQYLSASSANDNIPDYDLPVAGTMQSGQSYSSSTLNTHYNYQVQNLKTVTINRQGQYVMSGMSGTGSGAVTPGAAGDEVRVDCCLMTNDGRSVVTGSSLGPPQVWDMQTGELQNIMKGDSVGSTNLHLVCGDRLMVGAVHADMEINEYSGRKGVFNHTLQIWDFSTAKPLSMAEGEYCSAMCPMSDSDKVLFARTDKYGDATSVIAWDLLGNQAIKTMRYDAPIGNNDYISYLNLSNNDRYVVAGFTNSFDNQAEFMVFDMTLTSYNINEPAMLKLDANPECTAILPKDEAVTGLRNGDLVIWSIRTGQPSRQLMGGGGAHAHNREVKSVTLSKDGQYLVSTSVDGTAKVWDMHTERPIHTLTGHSDEVWCSAISADNEIVATGSNDGTIRLWRMKNGTEMCVFNCGVDIFFLTMSLDKGTIVALGDKFGARKLIMLQVVRTKIKKIVTS